MLTELSREQHLANRTTWKAFAAKRYEGYGYPYLLQCLLRGKDPLKAFPPVHTERGMRRVPNGLGRHWRLERAITWVRGILGTARQDGFIQLQIPTTFDVTTFKWNYDTYRFEVTTTMLDEMAETLAYVEAHLSK